MPGCQANPSQIDASHLPAHCTTSPNSPPKVVGTASSAASPTTLRRSNGGCLRRGKPASSDHSPSHPVVGIVLHTNGAGGGDLHHRRLALEQAARPRPLHLSSLRVEQRHQAADVARLPRCSQRHRSGRCECSVAGAKVRLQAQAAHQAADVALCSSRHRQRSGMGWQTSGLNMQHSQATALTCSCPRTKRRLPEAEACHSNCLTATSPLLTSVCVDGGLLAAQHWDGHIQHHHPRLKPAPGGTEISDDRHHSGKKRACNGRAGGQPLLSYVACLQAHRLSGPKLEPPQIKLNSSQHIAHLSTSGTGKSGWHSTVPLHTAVASTPVSVTSALSPARARVAGLPSTSIDLRSG